MDKRITVTSPLLPPLEDYQKILKEIWDSKWITNNGSFHKQLEKELADYLGVPFLSLFTNGTLPLITALQALDIKGEVITTPYSFVATTHSLWWNGIKPVFVDVDEKTCNIDPQRIEEAITPETTAIMGVHCYGTPCDIDSIQQIADRHGLKVIYDAAHAFGVKQNGVSVLNHGDLSTLSFHATKVYNTIEGGAMVMQDAEMKKQIDYLKNFGFAGETSVVAPGINSKMDEMRSAFGLLNLRQVDEAISKRKEIAKKYIESFKDIEGIRMLEELPGVEYNYSYFPIFVEEDKYGKSRDRLYEELKEDNIYGRRYFYPLISDFTPYKNLVSAARENLPVANKLAESVLCLPLHHDLSEEDTEKIIKLVGDKG